MTLRSRGLGAVGAENHCLSLTRPMDYTTACVTVQSVIPIPVYKKHSKISAILKIVLIVLHRTAILCKWHAQSRSCSWCITVRLLQWSTAEYRSWRQRGLSSQECVCPHGRTHRHCQWWASFRTWLVTWGLARQSTVALPQTQQRRSSISRLLQMSPRLNVTETKQFWNCFVAV